MPEVRTQAMVGVNFATITITAAMRISRRLGTAQLLQGFYNVQVLFRNLEFYLFMLILLVMKGGNAMTG